MMNSTHKTVCYVIDSPLLIVYEAKISVRMTFAKMCVYPTVKVINNRLKG